MKGNWKLWALGAAIGGQLLVLAGELIGAVYPLWTGQAVRLQVEPVDPRSLFRGNYARLGYEIGNVRVSPSDVESGLRKGEIVYVGLEEDAQGVMRFADVTLDQPQKGVFIRGRVSRVDSDSGRLNVRYGIEAYFLPRERALEMEARLRQEKAIAKVMLARSGKAALVEVLSSAQPD